MIKAFKVFIAFTFSLAFLVFVLLSAINFQLLSRSFVFFVFDSQNIYSKLPSLLSSSLPNDPNLSKEEKRDYTKISENLTPKIFEDTIKSNLANLFDFVWGRTKNINFFVPAKQIGLGKTDFQWTPNRETYQQIKVLHGIGQKTFVAWLTVLGLLVILFLFSTFTKPGSFLSGYFLLKFNGSLLMITGLVLEAAMFFVAQTLPPKMEPAQALLKLAITTVLPVTILFWIGAGVVLLLLGIILTKKAGSNELGSH